MVQSRQVSDYQCWKPCQCCHLLQVSSTWRGSTDSYGIDVPTRMTAVVGATGSSAISSSTSASSRQQQQQRHFVADCSLRPRRHHSRYSRPVHHAHEHQQATRAKTSSVSTSAKSVSTIRCSRCCAPSSQCRCCVMQSSPACVEHWSDTITTSHSPSNKRNSHSKLQSTPRVKNTRNLFEMFSYGTRSKTRELDEIERAEESRGVKVLDGSTGLQQGVIIVHKNDNDVVNVEKTATSDVSSVISRNANCTTILEKGSERNGYVVSEKDAENPLPIDGPYNWPFKIPSAPARPVKRSFIAINTTTPDARSPSGEEGEPTAAKKQRIAPTYSTNTFTETVSDDNSDADIVVIGETRAETAQTSKGRARLKETQLDYWRRTRRERGESNISMPIVRLVRFPFKQSMTVVTVDPETNQRRHVEEITKIHLNQNKMDTVTETSVQMSMNSATPSGSKAGCSPNIDRDNDNDDDIVYLKTTMKTVNADAHTSREKYRESRTNDSTSPADDTSDSVLFLDVNNNNNADTGGERVVEVSTAGNPGKIQEYGENVAAARFLCRKFKCGDTRTVSENVDRADEGDDDIYDVGSDVDGVEDDDDHIDSDDDDDDDDGSDEDAQEDDDNDDVLLLAEELFEPTRHQLSKDFQERYHRALDDDDGRGDFFYDSGEDFTLSGAEDSDDADEIELEESAKWNIGDEVQDDAVQNDFKESATKKSLEYSEQENGYESTSTQNQEREISCARTLCSLDDKERRCEEVEQLETNVGREPGPKIDQSNSLTSLAEESSFGSPQNPMDCSVTRQSPVSIPNGSPNNITKGASRPPRMTQPHVTMVAFLPDPDRAYCRLSWDTGPGVLIPLQSLFRVSRQCIPFVRDAGLHAVSIPHDIASLTEVANTTTTDFYRRPICRSKIFSFKDSTEGADTRDQESTNDNRDDYSERREPAHDDAEDVNHEGFKTSHCNDSAISIDDNTNSSGDDCIIVDTRTGKPETSELLKPNKIEKEQNSVEKPVSKEPVHNEERIHFDWSTISGNNETHTPQKAHSGETNSDLVRCTGESEVIETAADSSPTCVLFSANKQQPVDLDLCSLVDIAEDSRSEAPVAEGSQEGHNHENHSRNIDEFEAGLFLPIKEVWRKDIKAEVLGGACAYSDGQCNILNISLDDDNCKTSCDSTILDLSTNQTKVDDTNKPIKDNHFSSNNVASSDSRDNRTSVSSTSQRISVSSAADVNDPPGFSLAAPVQVDLSTVQ